MSVCQAFTGSGGWPTTIFLTPEQKPFFAGTYFPKTARYGQVGFGELPVAIHEKWTTVRVLSNPTEEYPLKNDKTTFYICRGRACQPPVNELPGIC